MEGAKMRMWMVNPKIMCNKHLLGEHCETHMFLGTIKKGIKVNGYIKNNLLEPLSLKSRHDDLAIEMINRGMKHNTELEIPNNVFDYLDNMIQYKIDKEKSYLELMKRCPECKKLESQFKMDG